MRWVMLFLGIFIYGWVYASAMPSPNIVLNDAFNALSRYTQSVSEDVRATHNIHRSVQKLIEDLVDFELIAKLSVGRTAWSGASGMEQTTFVQTFKDYMFDTYLNQLLTYNESNTQLVFDAFILKGNKAKVPCKLQTGSTTLALDFKLYLHDERWRIYDVEMDGVSLVSAFRIQFSSELNAGGLTGLTRSLDSKRNQ